MNKTFLENKFLLEKELTTVYSPWLSAVKLILLSDRIFNI